MKDYWLKLKLILLPSVVVSTCTTFFYLPVYYAFVITLEIPLVDYFTDYLLPILLSALATLIWIRPRLKMLVFKKVKDPLGYYYFVITGSASWVTIAAVSWLMTASNPVIKVQNAEQIGRNPQSSFYLIEDATVLTDYTTYTYTKNRCRGKHCNHESITLYITAPLKSDQRKQVEDYKYWIVKTYYQKESLKLAKDTRTARFNQFIKTALHNFRSDRIYHGRKQFQVVRHSNVKIHALLAIRKTVPYAEDKSLIILKQSTDNFRELRINYAVQVVLAFASGIILLMILLIFPRIDQRRKGGNVLKKYGNIFTSSFYSSNSSR